MAEVPCSRCAAQQEVPDDASRFKCATCGAATVLRRHDACGVVTAVPDGDVAWRCRGCGKVAGRTVVATLQVAQKVAMLALLAVLFVVVMVGAVAIIAS